LKNSQRLKRSASGVKELVEEQPEAETNCQHSEATRKITAKTQNKTPAK